MWRIHRVLKRDLLVEIDKKVKKSRGSTKTLIQHLGLQEYLTRWLELTISDLDKLKSKGASAARIQHHLTTASETLLANVKYIDYNSYINLETAYDDELEGDEKLKSLRLNGVSVTVAGNVYKIDTAMLLMRALED